LELLLFERCEKLFQTLSLIATLWFLILVCRHIPTNKQRSHVIQSFNLKTGPAEKWIGDFAKAGANMFTFHVEAVGTYSPSFPSVTHPTPHR
jgi:pentose-5-phosphate-3-epimerase